MTQYKLFIMSSGSTFEFSVQFWYDGLHWSSAGRDVSIQKCYERIIEYTNSVVNNETQNSN